ncbi:MAG: amidohydrolase family protein [Planctomycetota bacterium]|jgi:predicted TIM-barrel fold metal-dependent hydrolase
MLIDTHTHITPGTTKEKMEECFEFTGADRILALAAAEEYRDYWLSDANDGVLNVMKMMPEKVSGLIGIHPPNVDESLKAIDKYHKEGFVGIKLMPTVGYYPDDEKHRKVFEEINARKMIVLSHCGWAGPTTWGEKMDSDIAQCTLCSHPYHLEPLIRIFTDTDFIMAHGGGRTMYQAAFELNMYHENAWLDFCPGNGTWILQNGGREWFNILNWDRVLFGTDSLYGHPLSIEQFPKTKHFTECSLRNLGYIDHAGKMFGLNAERLLKKHGA